MQAGNFQANGIGADIDCSERGHGKRPSVYMWKGITAQEFAREPEAEVERNLGRSFCLADQHRALSVYFPRLRRGLRETDVGVRREFGDGMAEFTSGHVV